MNRFSWKQWVQTLRRSPCQRRHPVLRISRTVEAVEDRTLLSIQLVGDINPVSRDASPQDFTQIGSLTYFTADDGIHGRELWKTDGTAAGTVLVKDIHPADSLYSGSYPSHLTNVGGLLYFVADDGVNGRELWKSDGTSGGTQLVANLKSGGAFSGSAPSGLVSFNGSLYFTADDGINGRELWKSNGTSGGTQRITNLNSAGDSFLEETQPVDFNGQLIFAARQGAVGSALWTSNGTTAGTTVLKDLTPGADGVLHFDVDHVATTATTLYFVGNNASTGGELWKTDGTTSGTVAVKDILPGVTSSDPQSFTVVGNTLFFLATEATSGQELWKSDGSLGGTVIVKDIRSGNTGSSASDLVSFQGELYFAADDGTNGAELWKSDGSGIGTVLVKNINPTAGSAPAGLLAVESTLYFSADNGSLGRELWKSDGSATGTQLLKDVRPGLAGSSESFNPSVLGSLGNALIFSANDGLHGLDLWTSNGSTSGTVLVKDVNPITQGSYPSYLTSIAGGLVFAADDGQSGTEIWFSTGVSNSVLRLVDANTGVDGSDPADFTLVDDTVYFTALSGSAGRELWQTDGTQQGTSIVRDINPGVASSDPEELVNFNGELYFSAFDDVFGRELWKTDGSSLGTVRVADISLGGTGSTPEDLTVVGSTLYFRALGDQLWKSDGSEGGTLLVADVNSTGDSQLGELTNFDGTLFFVADDGVDGQELWQTNGQAEGTEQVLDIQDGLMGSQPRELTVSNGQLFFVADDGSHGSELWVSDGTPGATHLVEDIIIGPTSSQPAQLTAVNGQLFFVATDSSHGAEVWVSNGVDAGTNMVADLQIGSASSNPDNLAAVNGLLYFAANDGVNGLEPWKSNGTQVGTQLVEDLNPGSAGSLPRNFMALGSFLLFAADDGLHGVELMSDVTANHGPVLPATQFATVPAAPNGTLVGTLAATDVDVGQTLTYSIESGNTSDAFLLNPSNGQLTVNNSDALDPDVNPQFTLTVKVTDNGTPSGFVVTTVTVSLSSPNQVPTISNQTFSRPENSANNAVVGTVLANDADVGQVLTYAITAGNAAGAFSINAATGQITVANSSLLDFESTPSFALTVQVTDNGAVPLSASATITINLTNVDEPPLITLPAGGLTYTRGNPPVIPGTGATISDPDTPTLSFAGGNVTVSITQGQIKTDKLTVVNGGGVTRKGKNVLFNDTIVGKLSGGKKGQPVTVALNSSVTTSAVQQMLRQIGYSNTSKKTPAGSRTIQFRVTDSGNHTSPAVTKQITLV